MPHPDEGLIHAWLDGELDAAEAARVEALVASDPEWAAAAAEARGLVAASARIVGALDRIPANVIPKTAPAPRRATRQWMWRAAAAIVLVAGSAVVLQRETPVLQEPAAKTPAVDLPAAKGPDANASGVKAPEVKQQAAAALPARRDSTGTRARPALPEPAAAPAAQLADKKSTEQKKELDAEKRIGAGSAKDAASAAGELRSNALAATAAAPAPAPAPRKATDLPAAPPPVTGGAARQSVALEKTTRRATACFEQREPTDSARRILRLDVGALEDSIRLEKLTLRGDTLAAVNGRLTAIRVPCPGM